ncbi:hypothetical protein KOY48_03470 [Candidatus Minimicrobia naudis]|uniref:Uncharacterized protein n=1 Tax=Candidatus Minimicrobia naudis TaxID=2841263 RepID=A0A8F1SB50_9BACT|nr:hypothetical protein KOY48_03470 [Candidatus Minimicrobia naudis]
MSSYPLEPSSSANYTKKSAHTKSGVEVNVWATPAQNEKTLDFALDIATRSIDFYDEYFGVKIPTAKIRPRQHLCPTSPRAPWKTGDSSPTAKVAY